MLDVLVRDDNSGEPVGAAHPYVIPALFIDLFYLPEGLRGDGLGSRITVLAKTRRGAAGEPPPSWRP